MRWIRRLDEGLGAPAACAWIVRLDDAGVERSAAAPSPADLAHATQAHAADGGAARLWRRRLLRALAARWAGVHPDEIVFAPGEPRPARLIAPQPLFVSGASRGPWTVVAVGREPLGVDVELMGAEIEALGGSPAEALRRWTATEAYVKASGCDLAIAWDGCAAAPPTPARARLKIGGFPGCSISWRRIDELALAGAAQAEPEGHGWPTPTVSDVSPICRPDASAC